MEQEKLHIRVGNVVLHELSGIYYICENNKQEKWMNWNLYYKVVSKDSVPESYFKKGNH